MVGYPRSIEDLLEEELEAALGRERYQRVRSRRSPPRARPRQLITTSAR